MSARSSYTALQNITATLRRTTLPALPPALGFAGDAEFMEQLDIWKRWIQWEKEDPLVLKQEDVAAYNARILFVYKHALMAMRFWPVLWVDASDFCFQNDLEADGNDFLIQGAAANPESCLLAFKRADRLELSTANEEGDESALRRGTAVREPYNKVLDALYELCTKTKSRETQDIARIEANFTTNDNLQNGTTANGDNEAADAEEEADKERQKAAQIESVKSMHASQLTLLSKTLSHVWIALIRAMRRVQGKGKVNDALAGLRGTFADARKRGRITSDVYVACALIEFHCYEPETGKKIFERGLRLFPEDEAFALEYIKHLVANNDHTSQPSRAFVLLLC
jgi:cleavage stimulation factor subunit 3